jgi:chemotaxis protein CheX
MVYLKKEGVMQITEDQIVIVTKDVWNTVLSLEIKTIKNVDAGKDQKRVASFIQIMGNWEGSIILDCTQHLSKLFASKMFGMPLDEIRDEEIMDALGELINIVAGNLRAFLPQPCQLSLPAVIDGWDYTLSFPGGKGVNQILFECGTGQSFGITILKQSESEPFSKVVKPT